MEFVRSVPILKGISPSSSILGRVYFLIYQSNICEQIKQKADIKNFLTSEIQSHVKHLSQFLLVMSNLRS